ncbi:hypothetical protein ACJRO7_009652 [Eucalyptus globulus]|uniref:Uncharacterized protein n=1 Tax=Eucalyptus globulus TaxID=34317 RepID=A0ABD3LEY9_EUCGL
MVSGMQVKVPPRIIQSPPPLRTDIIGQEVGKGVIDEYQRQKGHSDLSSSGDGSSISGVSSSKLHAYVKLPSAEVSTSGIKKPPRAYKEAAGSSSQEKSAVTRTIESNAANQIAEAVFQQGEHCSCQAHGHRLMSNCSSCCKIVCEQEGEGLCNFPVHLLKGRKPVCYSHIKHTCTHIKHALLHKPTEANCEAYAKRLVEYDRNSVACTTVIDDQSNHYKTEVNRWLSKELFSSLGILLSLEIHFEEFSKEKKEKIEEAERATRSKVVMIFDLMISRRKGSERDKTEPNPQKKPDKAKVPNKSLDQIMLRNHWEVQHERNKLKHLVDDHLETTSKGKTWHGP